ncbi:MAG: RIP metalloprotease RseP, partial [Gammaproteobacteria bacterium]|nr:RIP metalloprotease RseP [Gammaproteobacteria bacterium]
MGGGVTAVIAFIIAIGLLVTVHEFGHFWVARRVGVKVLRFSVGFGRPLWRRMGRDGTEYVIAALPLGGYVKMLGEGGEEPVTAAEKEFSFESKSLAARAAIVAAGPLFNFIFAIFAFGLVQMWGVSGMKPVVGEVDLSSVASTAGLSRGDEIVAVNGEPVQIWQQALEQILGGVILGESIQLSVVDHSGVQQQRELQNPFGKEIPEGMALLVGLGFSIERPLLPPRIGVVSAAGAAAEAGLESGDLVLTVNGEPVESWKSWVDWVQESPEQPLALTIERDGVIFPLQLTPARVEVNQQVIGRIGASADLSEYRQSHYREIRYGVVDGLVRGAEKSWEMASLTLRVMGRMVVGATSTDGLSGPISIARYAGASMESGVVTFLSFLGLVSVSLGVLNLLPIPMLDGGHLFYYFIEWVSGSPPSESAMLLGQRIGVVFLVGLMSLALYND